MKILCGALAAAALIWGGSLLRQRNAFLAELDRYAGEYDPQSIVLRDTTPAKAEHLAELYGAELRLTSDGTYGRLTLPAGTDIRAAVCRWESLFCLDRLSMDRRVETAWETAAPEYPVTDPDYSRQTYLDYLNLGTLWETHRGRGITVAVIDTGIDTDHPEFAGRISDLSYNATEDKTVRDYGWEVIEDEQGHGTASGGVIAAAMDGVGTVGIAPEVELLVIKAECDSAGNFLRSSDLVFGLYYAISQNVRVVNMSFGFASAEDLFAEAVELAWDSDILCVAAACNRGVDTATWPAANAKVLGVGAIGTNWEREKYSNYGPNVDLVAPGKVLTTQMGGGYGVMEGTSFASPIVTAALALLLQQEGPYVEAEAAWDILLASCRDLGEPGRDELYGFGAPDVSAMVAGDRGTVTFDLGAETRTVTFLPGIPVQNLPKRENLAGWYYDEGCTQAWEPFLAGFAENLTLYAKWEATAESPWTYEILDDGTVKILSWTGEESVLSVPEWLDGRTVSAIGANAFAGQSNLRRIELPGTVTEVDGSSFWGAVSLESIGVSGGNEDFIEKDGVLFNTTGKILVSFPGGRRGHYAVPKGTNEIGDYAFAGSALDTVDLTGVRTLGIGSFRESRLTEIVIPDSVTRAWAETFRGCAALATVRLGSGIKSIPAGMFADCPVLKSVEIPDGIRTVSENAFANSGLQTVSFGAESQLLRIGEMAFYGCGLRAVTVPNSVTEIGSGAFGQCFALESLAVDVDNKTYTAANGVLLTADGSVLHTFPAGMTAETYILPASVREITPYAFAGTEKLGTLVIPEGFEKLGEGALRESGFEKLVLPESLETVGDYALANAAVKELTVPRNVTSLGRYAFAGSALEAVTFADRSRVETVPAYLFDGCESLTRVTFGQGSGLRYIQAHGFENAQKLTQVDLGDAGLVRIGNYGFRNCAALRAPALPNTLKSIGRNVFDGCGSLGLLTLPDSLEYMGSTTAVPGDADGNGALSYNDALMVLRFSIGLGDLDPAAEKACDVDGNGTLNYQDALVILRRSIGL